MSFKKSMRAIWHFLWEEDSVASWIANVVLAFVLIKFIVYPGIGFAFGTSHPIVAVVSGSMEHNGLSFDTWWDGNSCLGGARPGSQAELYKQYEITGEAFDDYRFSNGFNTGDLMVIVGEPAPSQGDVIVFFNPSGEPIIHRVVNTDGRIQTKGDNNCASLGFELNVPQGRIIGRAILRIPYLGWVKIAFLELLQKMGVLSYVPWFR